MEVQTKEIRLAQLTDTDTGRALWEITRVGSRDGAPMTFVLGVSTAPAADPLSALAAVMREMADAAYEGDWSVTSGSLAGRQNLRDRDRKTLGLENARVA